MEISGPANLNSKDSTVWHFKMWALAALTGDCINDGFSYENVWPFCRAEKKVAEIKRWQYYRRCRKVGFHCIINLELSTV